MIKKIFGNRYLQALLLTIPLAIGFYYTTGASLLFVPESVLQEHGIDITLTKRISLSIFFFGAIVLAFLIFYKRKIDFFRKVIFVPAAACFTIWFVTYFFNDRGHLFFYTPEDVNCNSIPFCHIVIPQTLLPALFTGEVIFPGALTDWNFSILGMVAMWFAVTLVLGRGYCSWVCFYGGWETGAASILKKPVIKKIPEKLKWGSFAMLFSMALASLVSLTVVYCIWLCPFQGVSEFAKVTDWVTALKFIIFALIFLGLVIVLPLLTKKRVQCISFCPFGAFQSLVDKLTPFRILIEKDKCSSCKKCIKECPMNSISEASIETGKVGINCVKCGKCHDVCHKGAVNFHLRGTPKGKFTTVKNIIFVYLAFFTLVLALGGMLYSGIEMFIGWIYG